MPQPSDFSLPDPTRPTLWAWTTEQGLLIADADGNQAVLLSPLQEHALRQHLTFRLRPLELADASHVHMVPLTLVRPARHQPRVRRAPWYRLLGLLRQLPLRPPTISLLFPPALWSAQCGLSFPQR